MADITPETAFLPVSDIEMTRVPDGAMVYQTARERVHFLNPTALIILELCSLNKTAQEIEAFVADAFGLAASPGDVVYDCLASLVDEGLVVCAPSSAAP